MKKRTHKKIQKIHKKIKIVKKKIKYKNIKNILFFCGGIFVLLIGIFGIWISSLRMPDFKALNERKTIGSTKIYDKTGEILLFDVSKDIKKTAIPFSEMGQNIKNATIAVEDADFYKHPGIKITSIIRAVLSNMFSINKTQGGSTITQQLIKNTLLTPQKNLTRKIKEWILAIKLEKNLSKDEILELYLNESPYGGSIYGIEEASREYFNKKPKELTLAESAYLAAIPQSPTRLSPYGKNKSALDERKNFVLFRMKELGYISEAEYKKTKGEIVNFIPKELSGIKAPHFVFFIKDYLEKKYGEDVIEKGGLKVITTLDYKLQEKAEEIVKNVSKENETKWGGKNGALVAIDPKTGHILSMVGSRNFFDKEIDGEYNVATALRQPGSSFKPFIYATAFNKGFLPETVLFDLPTEFNPSCNAYGVAVSTNQKNCYMPQNYDGKWRGPISLREALSQSVNIPAVKLFYLAGLQDSLNTAENMGITTLKDINRYGLTLVIGGGEVTLLDITSAYGVFGNNGIRNNHTGILEIKNGKNIVLEKYIQKEREVLPKRTALIISDILSKNETRIPTFGTNSALVVPGFEVAVKTGTTNSNKDAWTVGYTPSVSVGVWVGNNDNKPMKKGGVALAGPIWNRFMTEALKDKEKENFETTDTYDDPRNVKPILRGSWLGNETFFIDKISGKLATINTPKETLEEKTITNVHTILYFINKNNIFGDMPVEKDPQFTNWEIPIQNWWQKNSYRFGQITTNDIPVLEDDIHTDDSKPTVNIINPINQKTYKNNERIFLNINNVGKFPLKKIDIFINDIFLDSINSPFNYSFIPEQIDSIKNENVFKIISYDDAYNRGESSITFFVN